MIPKLLDRFCLETSCVTSDFIIVSREPIPRPQISIPNIIIHILLHVKIKKAQGEDMNVDIASERSPALSNHLTKYRAAPDDTTIDPENNTGR